MLKLLRRCMPRLSRKTALVGVLTICAFILADRWLGFRLLAAATPALLVLACLLPCLIHLALLRRKPAAFTASQVENAGVREHPQKV